MKTFYFICSECGKRKPQRTEESFFKPGLCKACYAKRPVPEDGAEGSRKRTPEAKK